MSRIVDRVKTESILYMMMLPAILAAAMLAMLLGAFDPVEWWRARNAPWTQVDRYDAMRRLLQHGKFADALQAARLILAREPESAEALRVVMALGGRHGKALEAVRAGEKLARLEPDNVLIQLTLAHLLLSVGEAARAEKQFRLVATHPSSTPEQRSDARAALEEYFTALDPDRPRAVE